eukprot:411564_1
MSTNICNFTARLFLVLWSIQCINAYNKTCTQFEACNGTTITCAANEDCSIDCNGYGSCLEATINCPPGAYKCDLNCYYTFACRDTTVNAAQTSGADLTITAEGRWVLKSSMITCPQTGNCIINFSGSETWDGTFSQIADNSVIDASNTVSGNLDITLSTAMDTGGGDSAYMKIYCPPNGECLVDCGEGGTGKCAGVIVEAQDTTTLLTVTGDGDYIFKSMSVTCPRQNGNTPNCIIMSGGNYTEPYWNFIIKSFESFTNVDMTCGNYDASSCINGDALPHMWCNEDFSIWCTMILTNDIFECKNDNPCQDWVSETRNCIDSLDILWSDFAIYSLDGNVKLVVQDDGNLCLYTYDGSIWIERFCTYTSVVDTGGYLLKIENGNVILKNYLEILFQTNTTTGSILCVEDCGMSYLYDTNGGIVWASDYTNNVGVGNYPFCTGCLSSSVDTNYDIPAGTALYSSDYNVRFTIQNDGNICLYTNDGTGGTWIERLCSGTLTGAGGDEYYLSLQTDGNMVLYDGSDTEKWSSNTAGKGCLSSSVDTNYDIPAGTALYSSDYNVRFTIQNDGNICLYTNDGTGGTWIERLCSGTLTGAGGDEYYLSLQIDGNMVLYDGSDTEKWSSNTAGKGQPPIELCIDNCGYAYLKDVNDNVLWYSVYVNNIGIGNYPTCTQPPTTTEEEYSTTQTSSGTENTILTTKETADNQSGANNAIFIGVFAIVTFYLM